MGFVLPSFPFLDKIRSAPIVPAKVPASATILAAAAPLNWESREKDDTVGRSKEDAGMHEGFGGRTRKKMRESSTWRRQVVRSSEEIPSQLARWVRNRSTKSRVT